MGTRPGSDPTHAARLEKAGSTGTTSLYADAPRPQVRGVDVRHASEDGAGRSAGRTGATEGLGELSRSLRILDDGHEAFPATLFGVRDLVARQGAALWLLRLASPLLVLPRHVA